MSDISISEQILIHQRGNEEMFAACVFASPEEVLKDYGWLPSSVLCDQRIGGFWQKVHDYDGDVYHAANDMNMLADLMEWMAEIPSTLQIGEYVRAITEDHYFREVLSSLTEAARFVQSRDITNLKSIVDYIGNMSLGEDIKYSTPDDLHNRFLDILDGHNPTVKTFTILDNTLRGMFPGDLILLAGRPGTGKTQLALQIGLSVAFNGKKVLFFSLEMDERQLWARVACPMAGYEWADVRAGKVDKEGLDKIKRKSNELREKLGDRFIVVDDKYQVSDMQRAAMDIEPDLVIVDQLDEIDWHIRTEKKVEWYGKAAKFLRDRVAKKLGIPLILIHQINRDPEDRQDKRPFVSDLKWSGELEQRADVILLMYREDLYTGLAPGQNDAPTEVNVGKNRQGTRGATVLMNYNLKKQWFS